MDCRYNTELAPYGNSSPPPAYPPPTYQGGPEFQALSRAYEAGLANGTFAGQRGNASAHVSPSGALYVRAGDGAHQAFAFHPPRPAPQNTYPSPGGAPSYTPWYKTGTGVCVIVLIVLVVVIAVAVLAIKFADGTI